MEAVVAGTGIDNRANIERPDADFRPKCLAILTSSEKCTLLNIEHCSLVQAKHATRYNSRAFGNSVITAKREPSRSGQWRPGSRRRRS